MVIHIVISIRQNINCPEMVQFNQFFTTVMSHEVKYDRGAVMNSNVFIIKLPVPFYNVPKQEIHLIFLTGSIWKTEEQCMFAFWFLNL